MDIDAPRIKTPDDFNKFVAEVEGQEGYERPYAFGVGLATHSAAGNKLDTWFPHPNLGENFGSAAVFAEAVGHKNGTQTYPISREQIPGILDKFSPFINDGKKHPNIEALQGFRNIYQAVTRVRQDIVATFIGKDGEDGKDIPDITDVSDAYLRLHLLSHLKVKPNGINLEGIFGQLPNVAWTNEGPIAIDELNERRMISIIQGTRLSVYSQDKFPVMLDYVTPHPSIRITNARNVRLGSYVEPGTTIGEKSDD